jgi:uncharacterized protein YndB with AHSA1/START domain
MGAMRRPDRSGTRGYANLIEVDVPIGRVWRALIDPALVSIWAGEPAKVDARMGGIYRIGGNGPTGREAHIDIFDPNRRLRLIYMPMRGLPRAESALVDDFLLDVRKNRSSVRLLGSGIPEAREWDPHYVRIRLGWERLMARLKVMLENPPPKKTVKPPSDPPLPGLDY